MESHEDQVEARWYGSVPGGKPNRKLDAVGMPAPAGKPDAGYVRSGWKLVWRSLAFRCRCVVFFDIFAFAPSCVAESSAAAERLLRFVRMSFLPTDVSTWHRDRYCFF